MDWIDWMAFRHATGLMVMFVGLAGGICISAYVSILVEDERLRWRAALLATCGLLISLSCLPFGIGLMWK